MFNLLHLCIALVIQGGSVLFNSAFHAYWRISLMLKSICYSCSLGGHKLDDNPLSSWAYRSGDQSCICWAYNRWLCNLVCVMAHSNITKSIGGWAEDWRLSLCALGPLSDEGHISDTHMWTFHRISYVCMAFCQLNWS